MLEATIVDLVFTISLKRSTLNPQLSTSCQADYPIFWRKAGIEPIGMDDRYDPKDVTMAEAGACSASFRLELDRQVPDSNLCEVVSALEDGSLRIHLTSRKGKSVSFL